jgi:hypothetical protein
MGTVQNIFEELSFCTHIYLGMEFMFQFSTWVTGLQQHASLHCLSLFTQRALALEQLCSIFAE